MDDPADTLGVLQPDADAGTGPTYSPDPTDRATGDGAGLMATARAATSSAGVAPTPAAGTQLETTHGSTTIADVVVARTAAQAVRAVGGVHALGSPAARVLAAGGGRLIGGRRASAPGVTVEVAHQQTAVDVTVIVDYGTPIDQLAGAVRDHVTRAVEAVTGLHVLEVNITVADLHQPERH